eukprot:471648-Prymnesium_polylepis.3
MEGHATRRYKYMAHHTYTYTYLQQCRCRPQRTLRLNRLRRDHPRKRDDDARLCARRHVPVATLDHGVAKAHVALQRAVDLRHGARREPKTDGTAIRVLHVLEAGMHHGLDLVSERRLVRE